MGVGVGEQKILASFLHHHAVVIVNTLGTGVTKVYVVEHLLKDQNKMGIPNAFAKVAYFRNPFIHA
jgi:uncharacterized pyridoxamine 5'-phosphate oxidase family protein